MDGPVTINANPLLNSFTKWCGVRSLDMQLKQQQAHKVICAIGWIFRSIRAMQELLAQDSRTTNIFRVRKFRRQNIVFILTDKMQPVKTDQLGTDLSTTMGRTRTDMQHLTGRKFVTMVIDENGDSSLQHKDQFMAVNGTARMSPLPTGRKSATG